VEPWYLRDREGRETDFLLTLDRKPWIAVEAKVSEQAPDPALKRFRAMLRIPHAFQVVLEGERDFLEDGVRVLPAARFLAALA
jgi:predicted AAA+ superfamily ATPase